MTDQDATRRAAPPEERRSAVRRAWLVAGLVAAAVLTVVAVSTGEDDGPPLADDRSVSPVVVDAQHPVQTDGATVTTPCYRYRVPDDLVLDSRSSGCGTVIGFGADSLTQIRIQATQGGTDDIDAIVANLRGAGNGAQDVETDTVTVAGQDAIRIRCVDGWGIRTTSYLVPLPPGGFSQSGVDLDSIWLTSPQSPEFDRWMSTVLDSLEIPAG